LNPTSQNGKEWNTNVEPKLSNTKVMEWLGNPEYPKRGIGLLITGGSRDERAAIANTVLRQSVEERRSWLSMTPFEIVAASHLCRNGWLSRVGVLLINELGELSQAEQDAIQVIDAIFTVTRDLERAWSLQAENGVSTVVTTEYELPELINELGKLRRAEQDAMDVIDPIFTVARILENVLSGRERNGVPTLVTSDHELPQLATQFGPPLASLLTRIGFSIALDEDGELHADRS
jgi:hypothetical protein